MAEQKPLNASQPELKKEGITSITVGGFKSISQEQSIEIRPLTILAGANSSGKSSIMQPLLLLKQTLEASYDPGALLLNGPNVKFTLADQLLSRTNTEGAGKSFYVGIEAGTTGAVTTSFTRSKNKGFDIEQVTYKSDEQEYKLYFGMPQYEIRGILDKAFNISLEESRDVGLVRKRCLLVPTLQSAGTFDTIAPLLSEAVVGLYASQVIHLPGLRGSPERDYPATAVGPTFPGTFEFYVASIIEQWQMDDDTDRLEKLYHHLARLALTRKVIARRKNDTAIELLVNRILHSEKEDMVSIADVGLGVSQALPVVVALHTADPGQLVYIEQPEIHLHPHAQYTMAEVLADAAIEGKRLVVETHSSLLLLGIQTLVAEKKLPPELVKLHWFTQQENGSTLISSADLDKAGAYGDWPGDFDTVMLRSESRYLDAAEARLMEK